MTMKFSEKFVFGAATAAYQAEGATKIDGKGKTFWDDYLEEQGVFDPSVASDFYHKYKDDLSLSRAFGINGIRISIAWTRIFPNGTGEVNPIGVKYYHDLLAACKENDIEAFVTLHHFDTPEHLYKKGDWLSQEMVDAYVNFADFCFSEFGDEVKYWITINEPWSVVAGQYIIGHFPPNIHYDIPKAIQSMHNMMVAHARVVNLYKALDLKGEIGIVHILESKIPISKKEEDILAANKEHVLANQFMLDATFKGEYTPETMLVIDQILTENNGGLLTKASDFAELKLAAEQNDFLGVNYYASHFLRAYNGESNIRHNGTGEKGSSIFALKAVGERVTNPVVPTTDWDWPIYPQGLYEMLIGIAERYPNYRKMYITENGMGDKDQLTNQTVIDDARIDYVKQHLQAILEAVQRGVNVQGYFIWSLMDVFSWTNGYNKRYGLFYVDFETQERFPKKSAYWYKEVHDSLSL